MLEPAALPDFFTAFFSAAMVILAGAGYALLYAWGEIKSDRRFRIGAALSYAVLAAATAALSKALHLQGHWLWLAALMLGGYLLAPLAVWRLCVGTHALEHVTQSNPEEEGESP
ncbi:hypothetical protein [Methylogaea oryzae]|uniref:hypothetical protein n=1 Tax=Methylogaea oryzae TaxID=1295382 RepID=UPI0006CFF024|nr:hypothetical protein [Methylogaea oryzae]